MGVQEKGAGYLPTAPSVNSGANLGVSPDTGKLNVQNVLASLRNNLRIRSVCSESELQQMAEDIVDSYTAQVAMADAQKKNDEAEAELGVSAADLLQRPDAEIPTLFTPILPLACVGVLAGESDANKSMFLRNLAICTVTGRDFLGYKFSGTRRAVTYVSTEDNEAVTQIFLKRNNEFFRDSAEEWQNLRFLFGSDDVLQRLENSLNAHPADLVVIDSLSDVFDGKDTNNMAQMRKFLRPFTRLANEHECLVLFLHHIGKDKETLAPSKNLVNGSQAIEAAARCVFLLTKDKSDDFLRHFCIVKHNYLPPSYKKESIVLSIDPNTLTFTATGGHVPFELLGEQSGGTKEKPISQYGTDEELQKFFMAAAANKISRTGLMRKVKDEYGTRQNNAYRLLDYAVSKEWLAELPESEKNNSTYYVFNCF